MGAVPGNRQPMHSLSDSIQLMNTIKLYRGTNTISHFSNTKTKIFLGAFESVQKHINIKIM